MPCTVPRAAVITDSQRTLDRTCDRVIPTARTRPSSRRRSNTLSTSVMTMPTAAMITDSASSR